MPAILGAYHLFDERHQIKLRFFESNKLDLGIMLQMEYWLEEAMRNFDSQGATALIACLSGGIEQANPYLYQFMRSINSDFFELHGGKTAFRKLAGIFKRAIYATQEYHSYNAFLILEATKLQCKISELELSDDHIDYDKLTW